MKIFPILLLIIALCSACGSHSQSTDTSSNSHTTGGGAKVPPKKPDSPTPTQKSDLNGACQKTDDCKSPYVCGPQNTCIELQKSCGVKADCSNNDEVCLDQKCVKKEEICHVKNIQCPNENYECKEGACVPTCKPSAFCGGGCCANNETCFENSCRNIPKPAGKEDSTVLCQTSAGASGVEWCGKDEGCFKTSEGGALSHCVPLSNTCDIEQERYCKVTEYCDAGYGRCASYKENKGLCVFPVEFEREFTPLITWTSGPPYDFNQVMATPIVADLHKDQPGSEIIFTTFHPRGLYGNHIDVYYQPSVLRMIRGVPDTSGKAIELWNSAGVSKPFYVLGSNSAAVADINNDGELDIVINGVKGTVLNEQTPHFLFILDKDGGIQKETDITKEIKKAITNGWLTKNYIIGAHTGPIISDLDGDGKPEILLDFLVFDNEGNLLCELKDNNTYYGATNTADFNNDNKQEIIAGNAIFTFENKKCTFKSVNGTYTPANAVANVIKQSPTDETAEIVSVAYEQTGEVTIDSVDPTTFSRTTIKTLHVPLNPTKYTQVDCQSNDINRKKKCFPGGGSPNIADFNGDGHPDIGVAGRWYYVVFDVHGDKILWKRETKDESSATTSSSVFDFNADGKAEVVYNDEDYLYVYNGEDGEPLIKIRNTTATLREYPVIADVNHDGHANIVVVSNNYYPSWVSDSTNGIRVYSGKQNNWVPTRRIWNQFAYRVTNINEDGSVPSPEAPNWKQPWLNNYLQNVQKGNPFLAPNVVPVIKAISSQSCEAQSAHKNIIFDIKNIGSKNVAPKTVSYKVVAEQGATTKIIGSGVNQTEIIPTQAETIKIENWTIPSEFSSNPFNVKFILNEDQSVKECNFTDNTKLVENIQAGAPDLSVSIDSIDTSNCYSQKLTINYSIKNEGILDIAAGTPIKLKVYAGTSTPSELIQEIEITKGIPHQDTITGSYEWNLSSHPQFQYQSLIIKLAVDEDNDVIECKEDNNDTQKSTACILLG